MKKQLKKWNTTSVRVIILIFLILAITVIFHSLRNEYTSSLLITYLTSGLILIVLLALITKSINKTILLSLTAFYSLLSFTWGLIIPYISLLPICIAILIFIEYGKGYTRIFLASSLGLTLLELLGVVPVTLLELTVGRINLLIIFLFQLAVYALLYYITELLEKFGHLSNLDISELTANTSKNFLDELVIKGLYASLLLHFSNNVLNTRVWGNILADEGRAKVKGEDSADGKVMASADTRGAKVTQSSSHVSPQNELLALYANSERKSVDSKLLVEYTGVLVRYFKAQGVNCAPPAPQANLNYQISSKLLLVLLHDIIHNHAKFSIDKAISISFTEEYIEISSKTNNYKHFDIWNRNLGNLRQLIRILDIGEVKQGVGIANVVTTKLTINK